MYGIPAIKWSLVIFIALLSIPPADALEYTTVADVFHNFSTAYNSECVYNTETETIIGNINGTIDEVKIYNRALSASEISGEYNLKRDYFDSIPKEESGLSASENWDLFVSNGTLTALTEVSVHDSTTEYDHPFTNITKVKWNSTIDQDWNDDIRLDLSEVGFTGTLEYVCIERYCNNVSQSNWSVSGDILTYYVQKEFNESQNMSLLLVNGTIDDSNPTLPGTSGAGPYAAGMAAATLIYYYYRRRRR